MYTAADEPMRGLRHVDDRSRRCAGLSWQYLTLRRPGVAPRRPGVGLMRPGAAPRRRCTGLRPGAGPNRRRVVASRRGVNLKP
ncbi:predicted protein [Streptomyces sp. SPB78]|nr:predicted protein [Streptomyces sp. SPB78]